jgi:hypothetical protein
MGFPVFSEGDEDVMLDEGRRRIGVLVGPLWTVLFVILFALSLFHLGYAYLASPSAFNSDNLMCSVLCSDLLHGRDVTGWHLPGAPYLFPDLALLTPCQALAPNVVGEFLSYCFVFHLLLLSVLIWLGRLSGLGWQRALIAAACGSILLTVVHRDHSAGGRSYLLVHAGSHTGAILIGLFLLALTIHTLRRGQSWTGGALFLFAATLGTFSDKLLVAQFLAPLVLALIFLAAGKLIRFRQAAGFLTLMGISFLLAQGIQSILQRLGFHFLDLETHLARLRLPDLFYLFRHLYQGIEGEYLLCMLIPLHLLAALLVIRSRLRISAAADDTGLDRRTILLASLTIALSPLCILGALFVLDMAHHPAIDRYTLSCWFLPCLLLPLLICWLPGRAARAGWGVLQAVVVLLALLHAGAMLPGIDRTKFEQPYPPLARELDRLSRLRGPLRGVGGFWLSRSTGWFTREPVAINALSVLGEPWFHASNAARFLPDDAEDLRVPSYQFLLLRPGDSFCPTAPVISLHFGEPAEKIAIAGDEIWLYDKLRSSQFHRFLLSRLADRLCAQRPFTGPVEPACLARPKPNLTPADDPGNISLDAGQSLEVRFARPISGQLLNVGADFINRMDLDFYRGEERIGSLPVPMVPWTGASYCNPGIQSRLLPLSAALHNRPWDRIVVRPRPGRGNVRLGHLLVFAETVPGLDEDHPAPCPSRVRLEGEALMPVGPGTPFRDDAEPAASSERVRVADVDFSSPFCFTQLLFLQPGRYRLECAAKVGANTLSDEVARLRITCLSMPEMVIELPLRGRDFPSPNAYATHALTFEVTEETEGMQIGVLTSGKTPIAVDYLDLIAEPPGSPGEKR